jgi:hypothetical protein
VVLGGDRHLSGHGPHEARPLPRPGHGAHVGVLPACDESSVALTAPDLGLPAEVMAAFGLVFESPLQLSGHLGGVALGPGACDQSPSGLGVAGVGDGPRPALLTGGICRGNQAQACHPFAWLIHTRAIANVGHHGDSPGAWHTAESQWRGAGPPERLSCRSQKA